MKNNKFLTLTCILINSLLLIGCANEQTAETEQVSPPSVESLEQSEPIDKNQADIVSDNNSPEDNKETEDMQTEEITTKEYVELEVDFEVGELFTDPMLMNPSDNAVTVVWYTENEGEDNCVYLYELGTDHNPTRRIDATTSKLSRIRGGKTKDTYDDPSVKRDIYKHTAYVDELPINDCEDAKVPYCVATDNIACEIYELKANAQKDTPQKILLTSDHQLKEMSVANIQKVYETVGNVDVVLANGDLADVPDRAYDWFDADNSFFRVMQGRADYEVSGTQYSGAKLLQYAPIYTSIGNHDVMGVYSDSLSLAYQFNNPRPDDFNTISYEELFDLPSSRDGGEKYYAFTTGDTRVIVLEVARIWRLSRVGILGKYSEQPGVAESEYGYGQFIFEPIDEDSAQLNFLKEELASEETQSAKYKIVMYHYDNHSLGGNTIPAYTNPVSSTIKDPKTGLDMVIYDYPIDEDYLQTLVEPLLEEYNVDLLFVGHSHIWNRFQTDKGLNILETSNVGNTYRGFWMDGEERDLLPSALIPGDEYYSIRDNWNMDNYILKGDPQGLEPIYPNVSNLPGNLPYLASNTITEFSVFDTERGVIDSYYFDTQKPDSDVVLFDSFEISRIKVNH